MSLKSEDDDVHLSHPSCTRLALLFNNSLVSHTLKTSTLQKKAFSILPRLKKNNVDFGSKATQTLVSGEKQVIDRRKSAVKNTQGDPHSCKKHKIYVWKCKGKHRRNGVCNNYEGVLSETESRAEGPQVVSFFSDMVHFSCDVASRAYVIRYGTIHTNHTTSEREKNNITIFLSLH